MQIRVLKVSRTVATGYDCVAFVHIRPNYNCKFTTVFARGWRFDPSCKMIGHCIMYKTVGLLELILTVPVTVYCYKLYTLIFPLLTKMNVLSFCNPRIYHFAYNL